MQVSKKRGEKPSIAIIGMACRFPEAKDYEEYWKNNEQGKNAVKRIGYERWKLGKHVFPQEENSGWDNDKIVKYCATLDDIDKFDDTFFHISPREAKNMDPQQRILLEETWHCIEDAGVSLEELQKNPTSVYVGASGNDYEFIALSKGENIDSYASVGNFQCILSNRISHQLNLSGESMTLDTACSSSLVALHKAKQSLMSGEAEYSIAAGVCLAYLPWRYITFSKSNMMSVDGQCKAFDHRGNGFIQGEGVGVLLLQKLEDAIRDKNHIYGIVKGSAVNHCGGSPTITAPSMNAQKAVITNAFADAGIEPETVNYIETHGTGTALGDPIEIEALRQVFEKSTSKKQFCSVGSVKTNIGHLASASGVAGVIRVLEMMQHKTIPKTLNLTELNPLLDWETTPFYVATENRKWERIQKDIPLRAGVSGFGFGGVNAHIILEEYQMGKEKVQDSEEISLFTLAAGNESSLKEQIKKWKQFLAEDVKEDISISSLCKTLVNSRRMTEDVRVGKVVRTLGELRTFLGNTDTLELKKKKEHIKLTLRMGNHLYSGYQQIQSVFQLAFVRRELEQYTKELDELLKKSNENRRFQSLFKQQVWQERYRERFSMIVQYVLVKSLLGLGIPVSEITCEVKGFPVSAAVCQSITLKDMWNILSGEKQWSEVEIERPMIPFVEPVYQKKINRYSIDENFMDAMIYSITFGKEDFETLVYYVEKAKKIKETQFTYKKYLEEWNRSLKDTGTSVEELLSSDLKINGKDYQKLLLLLITYGSLIKLNQKWNLSETRKFTDPRINSLVQCMLDEIVTKETIAKALLGTQKEQILLMNQMKASQDKIKSYEKYTAFNQYQTKLTELDAVWIDTYLKMAEGEQTRPQAFIQLLEPDGVFYELTELKDSDVLEMILELWKEGIPIAWNRIYPYGSYQRVALPTYAFQKKAYWIPLPEEQEMGIQTPMIDCNCSKDGNCLYRKRLSLADFYVRDHVVDNKVILPGVAYVEMAREAGTLALGKEVTEIRDISWVTRMEITSTKDAYISIHNVEQKPYSKFEVYTEEYGKKIVHALGKLSCEPLQVPKSSFNAKEIENKCTYSVDKKYCYKNVFQDFIGFQYGEGFQVTKQAFGGEDESLEILELPTFLEQDFDKYGLHPSILDAALRAITWIGGENAYQKLRLHIPFALGSIKIYGRFTKKCYSHAKIVPETKGKDSGSRQFCISIYDEQKNLVMEAKDFIIREIRKKNTVSEELRSNTLLCTEEWKECTLQKTNVHKPSVLLILEDEKEPSYKDELKKKEVFASSTFIQVLQGDAYEKKDAFTYVIRADESEDYRKLLQDLKQQQYEPDEVIHGWCQIRDVEQDRITDEQMKQTFYSVSCFMKAAVIELEKKKINVRIWIPYSQILLPEGGMLKAFSESMASVSTNIRIAVHHYEGGKINGTMLAEEIAYAPCVSGEEIWHQKDVRKKKEWIQIDKDSLKEISGQVPYRMKGIYLITGGLGKLGLRIARYLCTKYDARVILVGRSELSNEKKAEMETIISSGGEVEYVSCDIANYEKLSELRKKVTQKYGSIHGIFHCAGVLGRKEILDADKNEMKNVLDPKVQGTVNLDFATRDMSLDFFVLFSSISSVIGDFGRGTYAAGNGFMDQYAQVRSQLQKAGKRSGKCISINWPIWENGGMQLEGEEKHQYYDVCKMKGLKLEEGMEVMTNLLNMKQSHIVFAYGERERMKKIIGIKEEQDKKKETVKGTQEMVVQNEKLFREKLRNYLKGVLSKATGVPMNEVDEKTAFSKYGIDSIMILDLNELLEQDFVNIPKTLFFEYNNLKELEEFFLLYDLEAVKKAIHFEEEPEKVSVEEPVVRTAEITDSYVETLHKETTMEQAVYTQSRMSEDIAIVGLDGKYPMAEDLEVFWENLKVGKDCITEIPKDRWDGEADFDQDKTKKNKVYSKWGGFLDGIEQFDPGFFQMTPREAELIDPQERLMLETAYKTIEDAGYDRKNLAGKKVGVFIGIMNSQYQLYGAMEYMRGNLYDVHSSFASVANRISYFFDFHGPSIAMDTMCSSALTAIHLACESIKNKECEMALVGSVNAILHPAKYVFLSDQRFGSSEGRCRAFGEGGDGYVPGEGVGAILLKPVSKAVEEKDHIYGVIKATAMNHGGKVSSYTVPNPKEQAAVIEECIRKSGVNPRYINYIEAHGTGTQLGDPIEIAGLTKAFSKYTKDTGYCAIGSVKSNIGHLESAAGMASLTKVLLQMKYKKLVPSILAERLNANIDFEHSPFYVQRALEDWKQAEEETESGIVRHKRCAGISSFGAGGTNVHIIVEEYPQEEAIQEKKKEKEHLILLSAKNKEFLRKQAGKLAEFIQKEMIDLVQDSENAIQLEYQKEEVVSFLCNLFGNALGMERKEVDPSEELVNMGFDQVSAVTLMRQLQEKYPMLEGESILRYQNVEQLADKICGEQKQAVEKNPLRYSLDDLEYTLQVGRETFQERIAIISSNVFEIHDILQKYADGSEKQSNLYTGEPLKEQSLKLLFQTEAGKEFKQKVLQNGEKRQIAQMWLLNMEIDWNVLYQGKSVRRMSLPSHIFDDKPYWIGKDMLHMRLNFMETVQGERIQEVEKKAVKSSAVELEKNVQQQDKIEKQDVKMHLREIVGEIIYESPEKVDIEDTFSDYGVTSVLAMELIEKVNEAFGVDFSVTDLFSYTNIQLLATEIEKKMGKEVKAGTPDMMDVMKWLEEGKISPQEAEELLGGMQNGIIE